MADRTASRSRGLILLGFLLIPAVSLVAAESNGSSPARRGSIDGLAQRTPPPSAQRPKVEPLDRQREAEALALVNLHLPELKQVLQQLKSSNEKQYQRAIADLARSSKRLASSKNRDPLLYEIEVETLQANNGVNLLTAKLKVRDDEADRRRLRKAIERLQRATLRRAEYDVATFQSRLERAEQQLAQARERLKKRRENLDDSFETSYATSLRKAGRKPDAIDGNKPNAIKNEDRRSGSGDVRNRRPEKKKTSPN